MNMKTISTTYGDEVTASAGLHLRGIRITRPTYSLDVLPGFYVVPFSTKLLHFHEDTRRVAISGGVSVLCWRMCFGWLPMPWWYGVA